MKRIIKYVMSMMLVAVAALQGSSFVFAAESDRSSAAIEEIVVTATKREQSLQDVPVSISALSGDFLNELGASGLEDYFGFVPGMNVANRAAGQRAGQNIIVRGISNTRTAGIDSGLMSQTTGIYINDIPVTPVDIQLFDLDRIEVLRGPQGTLFGVGSMGGSVKFHMNKPDSRNFAATIEVSGEVVSPKEDRQQAKGADAGGEVNLMVNAPLIEGVLGARFVATTRRRPGYLDLFVPSLDDTEPLTPTIFEGQNPINQSGNTERFRRNTNSSEYNGATISVRYTPNDRLTLDVGQIWQREDRDDLDLFSRFFDDRGIHRVREGHMSSPTTSEVTLSTANISYEFPKFSIHADAGYYTRHFDELDDFTQLNFGLFGGDLDFIPALTTLESNRNIETYTTELRVQSTDRESFANPFLRRLDWVVGVFSMEEKRYGGQSWQSPDWELNGGPPLPFPDGIVFTDSFTIVDENDSFFFDLTLHMTDNLILAGGLRFFDQETTGNRFRSTSPPFTVDPTVLAQDETGETGRVNLSYRLSDNFMVFGSVADGFRLGGAVEPIDVSVNPACQTVVDENDLQAFASGQFDSDFVRTYEAGFKSQFADGRATVNGSVFTSDWEDLQSQIGLSQFGEGECTRTLTANVGEAEIDGVELEASVHVTEKLQLRLTGSYIDAEISNPGFGPFNSGDDIQNQPKFTSSAVVNYSTPITAMGGGDLFIRGTFQYVDDRTAVIGDPPPGLELDSYALVGLRAGVFYADLGVTVSLYGDNLFDRRVEDDATSRFGVGFDRLVSTSRPRSFGVTLRKDWR